MRSLEIHFLERHGERAAALGWTTQQLFGVHPRMGTVRLDYCGALMVPTGKLAIDVTETTIGFGRLTYYRDKPGKVWGPLVWEYRPPQPAPNEPARR